MIVPSSRIVRRLPTRVRSSAATHAARNRTVAFVRRGAHISGVRSTGTQAVAGIAYQPHDWRGVWMAATRQERECLRRPGQSLLPGLRSARSHWIPRVQAGSPELSGSVIARARARRYACERDLRGCAPNKDPDGWSREGMPLGVGCGEWPNMECVPDSIQTSRLSEITSESRSEARYGSITEQEG